MKSTKIKIEETAKNLGYTPNIHARRVKKSMQRNHHIGNGDSIASDTKYFDLFNQYYHTPILEFMDGVINGAVDEGYEVKLMPLNSKKTLDREFLMKHLEFPYSDGIIFFELLENA